MIKQKSEEMQLEGNDPLMSPNSKRRNESTLRQLQNDMMGKARSTLSSLGDVLKGSKSAPSTPVASGPGHEQLYKLSSNELNLEDTEHQFATPPRSPKTQKDKSSLDFFPWSKTKGKESSKSVKKDKLKQQQSQLSDVHEEEFDDQPGNGNHFQASKTNMPMTGTVKKKSMTENMAGTRYQPQMHKSKMKYSMEYQEGTADYRSDNDLSRSMEDGIQYISRDNVRSGEKYYDSRPRSYNEKYTQNYNYMYNTRGHVEYDERYEDDMSQNTKSGRKSSNPSSPAPIKHILFNEENDILYYKDNQRPSKTKSMSEHFSKDKPKSVPFKASSTRDNRRAQDSTPMPIRKASRDEKPMTASHGNLEQATNRNVTKTQKNASNIDDKTRTSQKPVVSRPGLTRDYSIDYRYPSNDPHVDSSQYGNSSEFRSGRALPSTSDECSDKKSIKKICFQEPAYEDKTKCDTLPRSRKSIRKTECDHSINEYLDKEMLRPRSGSLDSDLEVTFIICFFFFKTKHFVER